MSKPCATRSVSYTVIYTCFRWRRNDTQTHRTHSRIIILRNTVASRRNRFPLWSDPRSSSALHVVDIDGFGKNHVIDYIRRQNDGNSYRQNDLRTPIWCAHDPAARGFRWRLMRATDRTDSATESSAGILYFSSKYADFELIIVNYECKPNRTEN